MKRSNQMADAKNLVVDNRGRPLDGWHCTQCETKIDDKVMEGYPATIDPKYKKATCHKCRKVKVIKKWNQK
jgi:hypothetical protein